MTLADVPAIASIEATATAFPWTAKLFEDCIRAGHQCLIYDTDSSNNVAYTIVQQILDETHLLNICVAPLYQRQGYGRYMVKNVMEHSKTQKSVIILLEVRESNQRAQSLYQQLGFNEMSVRANYYPAKKGREDGILMALMLL